MERRKTTVTVSEALKLFELSKKADGIDPKGYLFELENIILRGHLDDLITTLNKVYVDNYKINLVSSGHLSSSSKNHYITTLRVFLYWCMNEGFIDKFQIKLFKVQEEPLKFFEEDEILKLLSRPDDNFRDERTHVIICLILSTGARASTVCNIKLEDIDLLNKRITFRHLKNKKLTILPITPAFEKAWNKYSEKWNISEYAFPDFYGNKLTVNGLRQSFKAYCKKKGVKEGTVHGLRHTFAREYIRNGGNAFQLQQILCHSTLAMTRHYVKLFAEDIDLSFSPLDRLSKHRIERTKM